MKIFLSWYSHLQYRHIVDSQQDTCQLKRVYSAPAWTVYHQGASNYIKDVLLKCNSQKSIKTSCFLLDIVLSCFQLSLMRYKMSLNPEELELHAAAILEQINELEEEFLAEVDPLKEELEATKVLISRQKERAGWRQSGERLQYATLSVSAAVKRYFGNGVTGWPTVEDLVKVLSDNGVTGKNLKASVGMALTALYRNGMLIRRNVGDEKQPKYEYQLKE